MTREVSGVWRRESGNWSLGREEMRRGKVVVLESLECSCGGGVCVGGCMLSEICKALLSKVRGRIRERATGECFTSCVRPVSRWIESRGA